METTTIERISNRTNRMIWFGEAQSLAKQPTLFDADSTPMKGKRNSMRPLLHRNNKLQRESVYRKLDHHFAQLPCVCLTNQEHQNTHLPWFAMRLSHTWQAIKEQPCFCQIVGDIVPTRLRHESSPMINAEAIVAAPTPGMYSCSRSIEVTCHPLNSSSQILPTDISHLQLGWQPVSSLLVPSGHVVFDNAVAERSKKPNAPARFASVKSASSNEPPMKWTT